MVCLGPNSVDLIHAGSSHIWKWSRESPKGELSHSSRSLTCRLVHAEIVLSSASCMKTRVHCVPIEKHNETDMDAAIPDILLVGGAVVLLWPTGDSSGGFMNLNPLICEVLKHWVTVRLLAWGQRVGFWLLAWNCHPYNGYHQHEYDQLSTWVQWSSVRHDFECFMGLIYSWTFLCDLV